MPRLIQALIEESFQIIALARESVHRQIRFPHVNNMIKVAIGMRRSGKSYFLYQTIHKLLDSGVDPSCILFINFEDDRLLPMTTKEMGALLDAFYSLYPENHERCCYLFLDEIQNIDGWHRVIRRYFNTKQVQLYLTGSSAKLLSKEINTSLRGRSLAIEVLPYSFLEYLEAHRINSPKKPLGQASIDTLQQHLLTYLAKGGFPAIQHMPTNLWRETLQNYVDSVILKDVIERHKISNIALLTYLTKTLIKSAGSLFSVNKFYNDIKSQGFKIGKDTLHNYLNHLQDTFLIFMVGHYSDSERHKQTRPKKLYLIDTGLMNAMSIGNNTNHGRLFKNLIYLDLRRQKKDIYYYTTQKGYEIDFVTVDPEGKKELIQVAWDMDDTETRKREERALEEAENELGIKGRIVTAKEYLFQLT